MPKKTLIHRIMVSSAGKLSFYRNLLSLDNIGILSHIGLLVNPFFKKLFNGEEYVKVSFLRLKKRHISRSFFC